MWETRIAFIGIMLSMKLLVNIGYLTGLKKERIDRFFPVSAIASSRNTPLVSSCNSSVGRVSCSKSKGSGFNPQWKY